MLRNSLLLILIIVSGCATFTAKKSGTLSESSDTKQKWFDADFKTIPVSDNVDIIVGYVNDLCVPSASYGQKYFAMRLARHAHELKNNKDTSLLLSKCAFMAADIAPSEKDMLACAEVGVAAVKPYMKKSPSPEASYYYGINLGLILQAKGLFAIKYLPEIVKALETARKRSDIDRGGPLRVLGMLYLKAPSWPQGVGDLEKSVAILSELVAKYPSHPQNYIFLAEALVENDEKAEARKNLEIAKKMIFPEIWGLDYCERWNKQIEKLTKKASD